MRCDKVVPCSRCRRLKKPCSREDVLTTKALVRNNERREDIDFLRSLHDFLGSGGSSVEAQEIVNTRLRAVQNQVLENEETNPEHPRFQDSATSSLLAVRTLESQVWSRRSTSCYPHRRGCSCRQHRSYSEMASINCDMTDSMLQWKPHFADPLLYLNTADARKIVEFHISHLWWHHNATHASTFLSQCNIFWNTGTIVHELWAALYLSILGVSAA